MHKGLTHATLGVFGAALLSGSVFAAGPTISDLPDLIISDKLKEEVVEAKVNASDPNIYDLETAATEDRYRFTDAFDLAGYVTYGEPDLDDVHFLLVEYTSDARTTASLTPSIRIYGTDNTENQEGFPIATPNYSQVIGSSMTVDSDGVLDFVNQTRSGSNDAGVPNPSPIAGVFTDTAYLTMFVASDISTNPDVDSSSFTVYTTNDETSLGFQGDALSGATSIFTAELDVDNFAGWYTKGFNSLPQFQTPAPGLFTRTQDVSNQPATVTPTPSVVSPSELGASFNLNVTADPTASLAIGTLATPTVGAGTTTGLAPQYAEWASWRRDHTAIAKTVNVDAGRAYMARWTVSGSNVASATVPELRFRIGEATAYGHGQSSDHLTVNGANAIVGGPKTHLTFFHANEAGEVGLLFDIFDYYTATFTAVYPNGHNNYTATVSRAELLSFDPDGLGAGTVILNHGGTGFALAAGEDAVPGGETAFSSSVWEYRDIENTVSSGTSDRNFSGSITGSQMSITLSAGNGNGLATLDAFAAVRNTSGFPVSGQEVLDNIGNDEVIRIDVWLSSPEGGTANNILPVVRFGIQTDAYGDTGSVSPLVFQGRAFYHTWYTWNRSALDVGESVAPVMALQTGARRFSAWFTPNLHSNPSATLDARPTIEVYSFPLFGSAETSANPSANDPALNPEPFQNGTVRVHRVMVTKYALPADTYTAYSN